MAKAQSRKSTGKGNALFLIGEGFEDLEFFCPYYRLLEEGYAIDVAAQEKGPVEGKHGYTFDARMTFADALRKTYDILVLPGGKGPETVRLDDSALQITRKMMEAEKPVAAICHAAQILSSAEVLRNRKATCWKGVRDDLKQAGGIYQDQEVVVDGNLISSRSPDDIPAFCREMIKALRKD